MILTDTIVDRVQRLEKEVLRVTARGADATRSDAAVGEIGTGFALFAGEGSPLTQIVGFAHRAPGNPAEIEAFFGPLAQSWEVSVTPFTDPETFRRMLEAGYRPAQFEGSLAQWVGDVPPPEAEIVEVEGDLAAWSETTWRGWTGNEEGPYEPDDLIRAVSALACRRYLAFVDGQPAASASMFDLGDSVVLGGAATRIPHRGHGLQAALLARRLSDAGKGRFALIGAMPGTASYRNSQRAGFTPLYSKLTLTRG